MSKGLRSVGEDIWKNKVEKVVCIVKLFFIFDLHEDIHFISFHFFPNHVMVTNINNFILFYFFFFDQNAELVTLTYGSLVAQLCRDYEGDYIKVNKQLERMGYNIGLRLIEDFLSRSNLGRCTNFRDTAETISKVGFKMFLNITPTIDNWTPDNRQFSLILDENPLAEFVELPDDGRAQKELWYSNILAGVIKGACEMVQLEVDAFFVSDVLQGAPATELRVRFIKVLEDEVPAGDD